MSRRETVVLSLLVLGCTVRLGELAPPGAGGEPTHEGQMLSGTVRAVSANGFTLETEDGERAVELSSGSQIRRDGIPTSRDALRVSERVEIVGPELRSGVIGAREVWIHSGTGAESPRGK